MASAIHDRNTLPPAHLDSDAAKFYEVIDGEVVKNQRIWVRESSLISALLDLLGPFVRAAEWAALSRRLFPV